MKWLSILYENIKITVVINHLPLGKYFEIQKGRNTNINLIFLIKFNYKDSLNIFFYVTIGIYRRLIKLKGRNSWISLRLFFELQTNQIGDRADSFDGYFIKKNSGKQRWIFFLFHQNLISISKPGALNRRGNGFIYGIESLFFWIHLYFF